MNFLGVLDNLKKDHVNALAIQLHCQKLLSLYLGYIFFGVIWYYKTFINVSVFTLSYRWVGYLHASSCPRAFYL